MGKFLRCSVFGMEDCPAEFRGETGQDVLEQAKKHGIEIHGQTEEQVNSNEVMRIAAEKTRSDDGS